MKKKKNSWMRRAKNKPTSGLKKWMWWINLVCIFLLILTYLTPHIPATKWGWLSLLALAYPFVLLANGLFALGWIFFRQWYAVFSILVILAGIPYHMQYVKLFSTGGGKPQCEETIRLITYNMRGLSLVPAKKGTGLAEKIDSLYFGLNALEEFPDILCLQEAWKGEMIAKRFDMAYSYHAPKSSLWILSRYPVLAHGEILGQEKSPCSMWADIKTPQGVLRVYNMHLMSNRVTQTSEELLQEMDLQKTNIWSNVRFIVSRYKTTTQKRALEAQSIRDHMKDCPHPAIIAGDGNDTPLSNAFHILSKDLQTSFGQRGSGLSTTYKSNLPLLRIDYLMGTSQIYFSDHYTHPLAYSDHYPVSSGICIRKPDGS